MFESVINMPNDLNLETSETVKLGKTWNWLQKENFDNSGQK